MRHRRVPKVVQDFGAEAALAGELDGDRRARSAALEQLLNRLLSGLCGLSPRATDGVLILREELGLHRYFSVAKVVMIADQSTEPASFDLVVAPNRSLASGRIHFGLRDGLLPRGINSRDKLETVLLAAPIETMRAIDWATCFERGVDGWTVVTSNHSGPA